MGCADLPSKGSVHTISVLEVTKLEVVGGSSHWPAAAAAAAAAVDFQEQEKNVYIYVVTDRKE